jgi:hypothetical protein
VGLDSLNPDTDPDPAFQVNPDPDNSDPDQGFYDQKLKKKNTAEFFFQFYDKKWKFTYP